LYSQPQQQYPNLFFSPASIALSRPHATSYASTYASTYASASTPASAPTLSLPASKTTLPLLPLLPPQTCSPPNPAPTSYVHPPTCLESRISDPILSQPNQRPSPPNSLPLTLPYPQYSRTSSSSLLISQPPTTSTRVQAYHTGPAAFSEQRSINWPTCLRSLSRPFHTQRPQVQERVPLGQQNPHVLSKEHRRSPHQLPRFAALLRLAAAQWLRKHQQRPHPRMLGMWKPGSRSSELSSGAGSSRLSPPTTLIPGFAFSVNLDSYLHIHTYLSLYSTVLLAASLSLHLHTPHLIAPQLSSMLTPSWKFSLENSTWAGILAPSHGQRWKPSLDPSKQPRSPSSPNQANLVNSVLYKIYLIAPHLSYILFPLSILSLTQTFTPVPMELSLRYAYLSGAYPQDLKEQPVTWQRLIEPFLSTHLSTQDLLSALVKTALPSTLASALAALQQLALMEALLTQELIFSAARELAPFRSGLMTICFSASSVNTWRDIMNNGESGPKAYKTKVVPALMVAESAPVPVSMMH
jgi:hypothetical protein